MPGDDPDGRSTRRSGRWETAFYLSLLIAGGLEITFHSVIPRWISWGGIPIILIYMIVGFVWISRRS